MTLKVAIQSLIDSSFLTDGRWHRAIVTELTFGAEEQAYWPDLTGVRRAGQTRTAYIAAYHNEWVN